MKKIITSILALALVGSFAFADDAVVIPKGVFRARLIPSYSMTDKNFDKDGKKVDAVPESKITALSGAFELGAIDPVTIGLKWAPGYYVASDLSNVPAALNSNKDMIFSGPADLEIGAKVQVFGEQGFVKNDTFRVAFTTGVVVPLDSYDAKDEFDNFKAGDAYRATSSSGHQSLGFGLKADTDYKINKMFFLNLHGQVFYYLPSEATSFNTVATYYGTIAGAMAGGMPQAMAVAYANANAPIADTKTEYGLEYAVEFEPHAKYPLNKVTSLSAGLPINYSINLKDTMTYNSKETKSKNETLLKVSPYVSIFTLLGPLPFEAQIQYDVPLTGAYAKATNTLTLQLKFFGKLY